MTGVPYPVKVGPYTYEFEYSDEMPDDHWGEHNAVTLTIRLALDQAAGQERDTVLHEVLHAVWSMMSIPAKAKEETAVHRMATGLLMVLRDNPELVRYLCE